MSPTVMLGRWAALGKVGRKGEEGKEGERRWEEVACSTVGQGSCCSKDGGISWVTIITETDHIHIQCPAELEEELDNQLS